GCSCHPHPWYRSDSKDQNRIQNKIQYKTYSGHTESSHCISHCRQNTSQHLVKKREHNQTAGNQKINSCISYNFGTVQHKKINQLPVKHYTDDPVKDSQKSTHSQCPSGILCGSLWSV